MRAGRLDRRKIFAADAQRGEGSDPTDFFV